MVIQVPNANEIQKQFEQAEIAMENEMEKQMIINQQIEQQIEQQGMQNLETKPVVAPAAEVKTAPKEKKVEEESPRLMAYRMFANKLYDEAKESEEEVEREVAKRQSHHKSHHGKKDHKKSGKGCCFVSFLFWASAWGYHFYHLYKLKVAVVQKKRETGGDEPNWGRCGPRRGRCGMKKNNVQGFVGQQQVQPAAQVAPATQPNYDYTISEPADEEGAHTNLVSQQTNSIN